MFAALVDGCAAGDLTTAGGWLLEAEAGLMAAGFNC